MNQTQQLDLSGAPESRKTFHVILIRPSHYDDDGYVIQWRNGSTPSNSLAVLYGLARDVAERQALGSDIKVEISAFDESNIIIPVPNTIRQIEASGGLGLVCFVGIQSNQFPRAVDLATRFQKAGIQTCIGGFHVSGCLSMLPEMPADLKHAMNIGISLFAGEAEGRFEALLWDVLNKSVQPVYNYMADLPTIESQPTPYLPADMLRLNGGVGSFDAGRGCPFICSFCTIINVQGRKSRRRSVDDIEQIVREHAAEGISMLAITDDNFARNQDWEVILDRLIQLREKDGITMNYVVQVDTMCHRIKHFIEKAGRAGVVQAFIGMESINSEALKEAKKGQNNILEYRTMLQAWRNAKVVTLVGYIIGFPLDSPESIRRDIDIIKRELPVDIMEFFILTPLPGSEDHKHLHEAGVWMDPDMNNYDVLHVTTAHQTMAKVEWERAYGLAWETYYTPEHIETVLRRAVASGFDLAYMVGNLMRFSTFYRVEKVHPLEIGTSRIKSRLDRRPGMLIENPLLFHAKLFTQKIIKGIQYKTMRYRIQRIVARIKADLNADTYMDIALTPVTKEDQTNLESLTK